MSQQGFAGFPIEIWEELIQLNPAFSGININDQNLIPLTESLLELWPRHSSKDNLQIMCDLSRSFVGFQKISTIKLYGQSTTVSAISFLGGDIIATVSWDKCLKICDAKSGNCIKTLTGHTGWIYDVCAISSERVATASADKSIIVWDCAVHHGEQIAVFTGHSDTVTCLGILTNNRIISGSYDDTLKIWELSTKAHIQTLYGHSSGVSCLCVISPNLVVSGSADNTLILWNTQAISENFLKSFYGHNGCVMAVSTFPATSRIVSGSADGTLKIWDYQLGYCLRTLTGHTGWVSSIAICKDNSIISGSFDRTIRVWDPDTGTCLQELPQTSSVYSICLCSGNRLVSGLDDGNLEIWG